MEEKDELLVKLLNGEDFTEQELEDLFEEYDKYTVDEWEEENRRWYCRNYKVLKVDDRYFKLEADIGLTENIEHDFDFQPTEVYKAEVKIIEKIVWKPLKP